MLDLIHVDLKVEGTWPPENIPDGPIVIVANHPFGIGDGIAVLALAEQPRTAGALAANEAHSRPAVSRHLRVLRESALVADALGLSVRAEIRRAKNKA